MPKSRKSKRLNKTRRNRRNRRNRRHSRINRKSRINRQSRKRQSRKRKSRKRKSRNLSKNSINLYNFNMKGGAIPVWVTNMLNNVSFRQLIGIGKDSRGDIFNQINEKILLLINNLVKEDDPPKIQKLVGEWVTLCITNYDLNKGPESTLLDIVRELTNRIHAITKGRVKVILGGGAALYFLSNKTDPNLISDIDLQIISDGTTDTDYDLITTNVTKFMKEVKSSIKSLYNNWATQIGALSGVSFPIIIGELARMISNLEVDEVAKIKKKVEECDAGDIFRIRKVLIDDIKLIALDCNSAWGILDVVIYKTSMDAVKKVVNIYGINVFDIKSQIKMIHKIWNDGNIKTIFGGKRYKKILKDVSRLLAYLYLLNINDKIEYLLNNGVNGNISGDMFNDITYILNNIKHALMFSYLNRSWYFYYTNPTRSADMKPTVTNLINQFRNASLSSDEGRIMRMFAPKDPVFGDATIQHYVNKIMEVIFFVIYTLRKNKNPKEPEDEGLNLYTALSKFIRLTNMYTYLNGEWIELFQYKGPTFEKFMRICEEKFAAGTQGGGSLMYGNAKVMVEVCDVEDGKCTVVEGDDVEINDDDSYIPPTSCCPSVFDEQDIDVLGLSNEREAMTLEVAKDALKRAAGDPINASIYLNQ